MLQATRQLLVVKREAAGDLIIKLTLKDPNGMQLWPWEPGAHIDLILDETDPENPLVRQYSLCGNPHNLNQYEIGVLNVAGGRGGSAWVHEKLVAGTQVTVTQPRNHFPFKPAPETQKIVFIAAGIGLTPLLPMAHESENTGRDWVFYQLSQNPNREALPTDVARLPPEKVIKHYSDAQGFFDFASLCNEFEPRTVMYACGPAVVLDQLEKLAEGQSNWEFHSERFVPKPTVIGEKDAPFDVEIASTGQRLTVPAGVSCLEVLRANGINIEWSCREGVCGTCETDILEGIPLHRDSVLTAEERESGETLMVCVSRAAGDYLKLDL